MERIPITMQHRARLTRYAQKLRRMCHTHDCKRPRECPQAWHHNSGKCKRLLNPLTNMAWNLGSQVYGLSQRTSIGEKSLDHLLWQVFIFKTNTGYHQESTFHIIMRQLYGYLYYIKYDAQW